jgi:DNA-binding CsgD family transcriptional regulator
MDRQRSESNAGMRVDRGARQQVLLRPIVQNSTEGRDTPQRQTGNPAARAYPEHRALLLQSLTRVERFSQIADRLAATMRHLGQPARAELYAYRAARARERIALLTTFLESIDQADAATHRMHKIDCYPALTRREHEVLELLTRGCSNRQIATGLVITRGTAQNHVAHILGKFGCRTRAEVIARFVHVPDQEAFSRN